MTDATLRLTQRRSLNAAFVCLVPLAFLAVGLVLRYLAYMTTGPDASIASFAQGLCQWDCGWYVAIAQTGYEPFPILDKVSPGNWAFFPMFPVIVAAVEALVHGDIIVVGTVVSFVMAYAAAVAAWPLLEGNRRAYILYSAFLLSGPFSFYFTTFYTEVLFVLLTTLVFVGLKRSNYLGASVAAALLSATRIVGVFIVFSIVVQAFIDYRREGGRGRGFVPWALKKADLVLAVFLAPVGLFAYMAFLYWRMGDALAFSHVQRAWARTYADPLSFIVEGLLMPTKEGFFINPAQQLALASILGLILTGILFWRRLYPPAVFSLISLLLPLCAGLASMLRFVAAQAPLMLQLMLLLSRWRWLAALTLLVFLVTDYFFTIGWLTGYLTLA